MSESALAPLLERLARSSVVALDTEFHVERHYGPRLMLVQVQPDDGGPAAWVDPLDGTDLRPLGEALSRVTLVVHGGAGDLPILRDTAGLRPDEVFDTQVAAAFVGDGARTGLQALVFRRLGRWLPKTETVSDWSRRPLTPAQEEYALDDVRVLLPLREVLLADLERTGRGALAAAAMQEAAAQALATPRAEDAWKTIGGAQNLDELSRATLRGLAAWREREARARDLPRGQVVSDALLLDLARRRPETLEALRTHRRFPSQVIRKEGEAILAVMARARTQAPPPPPRPWPRAWGDAVRAAGSAAEAAGGIAADLLLDDATLAKLHAGEALAPWRWEALGTDVHDFLAGRASLDVHGGFVRVEGDSGAGAT
jgi:ribonuclease D